MMPTAEAFGEAVGALGIDERQRIVVYDAAGLSSAPRVWWSFRVMGAEDVVLLAGGLPRWSAEKRALASGTETRHPTRFAARFTPGAVRDMAEIRDGLAAAAFQVVDARPADRFRGEAPEPRSWVKSGRIPGSRNVPSSALIADGELKDAESLRAAFVAGGVDLDQPIVTSCGSGVNAAILSLALETLGVEPARPLRRLVDRVGRARRHAGRRRAGHLIRPSRFCQCWRIWRRNSLVRSCCGLVKNSSGGFCSTICPASMKMTRLAI